MPCYRPAAMVDTHLKTDKGKRYLRYFPTYDWDLNKDNPDVFPVPCGRCRGCRLDYSKQWADRCMMELKDHDSAYFVTLTYDDFHVPLSYVGLADTGEALPVQTLRKRDLQLFFKRLRKSFPADHIRYFASGEYGSTSLRPHYHAILFGLHLTDLQLYEERTQGSYFLSPALQRVWSSKEARPGGLVGETCVTPLAPIGQVIVGECTHDSCAYVARYTAKKENQYCREFYDLNNIEPPFVVMSRRPGIGRNYYDSHPDIMNYEYINVSTPEGGIKFHPPPYFERLYAEEDPDGSAARKARRAEQARSSLEIKMSYTSMSYNRQLAVEEDKRENRTKILRRSL